jgi:hypothetical protein
MTVEKPAEDLYAEIGAALARLALANRELDEAVAATSGTLRTETEARNRVNEAQREVDSLVERVRLAANRNTDWGTATKGFRPHVTR